MYTFHTLSSLPCSPSSVVRNRHCLIICEVYTFSKLSLISSVYSRYNKTEDLVAGGPEMNEFTHLMIGGVAQDRLDVYKDTHHIIHQVEAFDRILFNLKHFPPVKVAITPKLWILKRNVQ